MASLRMAPACQSLGTDDPVCLEVELRLKPERQFSAVERVPQIRLQREPFDRPFVDLVCEKHIPCASRSLCVIHGGVGFSKQVLH